MTCKNCGADVKDGLMFCKKCGANVQTGIVPTAHVLDPIIRKERIRRIIRIAVIAIAIIIAVGVVFFLIRVVRP